MNEADKQAQADLKKYLASFVEKLESNGSVICPTCGVDWNKLNEDGVCNDCYFEKKERKRKMATQVEKGKGFQGLNDLNIFNVD